MSAFLHGPTLWYATRATGLVTMLLLTASVLLGILTTGRFVGGSWPRFLTVGLHRNLALLTLMFLAQHVIAYVAGVTRRIGPHRLEQSRAAIRVRRHHIDMGHDVNRAGSVGV